VRKVIASVILSAVLLAAPALAEDLEFMLVNEASSDLVGFYVSPASSDSWEESLIPTGNYLAPGYEIGVLIADGLSTCVYDIRGVFRDGGDAEDFGLDLCDLGEYTFTD
jgi:hypothetical protein